MLKLSWPKRKWDIGYFAESDGITCSQQWYFRLCFRERHIQVFVDLTLLDLVLLSGSKSMFLQILCLAKHTVLLRNPKPKTTKNIASWSDINQVRLVRIDLVSKVKGAFILGYLYFEIIFLLRSSSFWGRRCLTSTLIMVPINFWQNSDPFKKREHFSSSKIDRVRAFLLNPSKFP